MGKGIQTGHSSDDLSGALAGKKNEFGVIQLTGSWNCLEPSLLIYLMSGLNNLKAVLSYNCQPKHQYVVPPCALSFPKHANTSERESSEKAFREQKFQAS